ncbi:hypothetical protein COOONC_22980 [Cooperia oncophora]
MDTASSANLQEGNSTLNVERSNVEEEVVPELERDENGRSGEQVTSPWLLIRKRLDLPQWEQLDLKMNQVHPTLLRSENDRNARVKVSRIGRLWRTINPGRSALTFKKFHPNKLQKSEQIAVDHDMKNFSMYDIFHDIVLQPHMPLESVTSCFVKQFCTKFNCGAVNIKL